MSDEAAKPDDPAATPAESTPAAPTTPPAQAAPTVAPTLPIPGPLSTLTQPLAAVPASPQPVRYRRVLGWLTKIEIENYRAFRGHFELDLPEGCNLLVYGENGAGKSSLFNTLSDFLESPELNLKVEENRHSYNTDPAAVRLSFAAPSPEDGRTIISKPYEWSASKNEPKAPEMRNVDKGKGFLDYKSLLRIHLLPTGARTINLFDLFLNPLLANYKNPVTDRTFAYEWESIQEPFIPRVWKPSWLDDWIKNFNAGFERVVKDSVAFASKLLIDFDQDLGIDVEFKPASYTWRPKKLFPPTITLKPSFKRLLRADYDRFLNEARLSALAMAIYFSGLKQSPAGDLRLLVLDDILIGLDMANRMIVLEIIEKLFREWQVIILTYHKAWFEVLRARTKDGKWSHEWRNVTLRMRKSMGVEFPVVVSTSETLLAQARVHLDPVEAIAPDIKAAAVYARTAFEAVMCWYCGECRLPVAYVESRRELDTNDFLTSIESQLLTLRNPQDREFANAAIKEIKHARHFVLNPHSHYNPELDEEISAEIANGIRAVDDFDLLLRCLKKTDFAESGEAVEQVTVGELLASALSHLSAGRKAAALDALARAFEQHLDEWFKLRHEMMPYGQKHTTTRLFAIAGERKLFCEHTWLRLKHSKPYLLGDVHVKKLEPAAFESAVRLFLELRVQFLLGKKVAELTPP